MTRSLLRIEPDVRLEQVCDIEAMRWIKRQGRYRPDRAKSDSSQHPIHIGDMVRAPGAAFRSEGKWYALSFECQGSPDHLRVLAFTYKIGDPIPQSRWKDMGLWK